MRQILDHTDERVPIRRSLAPRSEVIAGTIGLLDINKARGDVMIERLKQRLAERIPGVELRNYRKPTPAKPAPDDVRHKMLEECDFVVEALAD
jgi:hypothetical protein